MVLDCWLSVSYTHILDVSLLLRSLVCECLCFFLVSESTRSGGILAVLGLFNHFAYRKLNLKSDVYGEVEPE